MRDSGLEGVGPGVDLADRCDTTANLPHAYAYRQIGNCVDVTMLESKRINTSAVPRILHKSRVSRRAL